jgi:hypothetical protein
MVGLAGSLVAQVQEVDLRVAVLADRCEARVVAHAPHALVALVVGVQAAAVPVAPGLVLGVAPAVVAGLAVADAAGTARVAFGYAAGHAAGLEVFVQAVAYDKRLALGQGGALAVSRVQRGKVPAPGDAVDLVVWFGQSNAEGAAPLADLPPEDAGEHPQLRIWNHLAGTWQAMHVGRNNMLLPGTAAVGPELGIVDAMGPTARPLWLVKCAVWQSSLGPSPGPLDEWGPAAGELYPQLLSRVDAAAAAVRALGLQPRVRLVGMMQGESDALSPGLAASYQANLMALLLHLRADLGQRGLTPDGPPQVRIGLIAPALVEVGFVATEAVRQAQQNVAGALPGCDTIETRPFAVLADRVHLALPGLRSLGQALVAGFVRRR